MAKMSILFIVLLFASIGYSAQAADFSSIKNISEGCIVKINVNNPVEAARHDWRHSNGRFTGWGNSWAEFNGAGGYVAGFQELNRDNTWVHLYDPSRDMYVSLSYDKSMWRVGPHGTWNVLYYGGWVD
ncbi:MAG: hypothetical protein HQK53_04515 [Oligoflexia bacterium]|nr:hypothetical protein [Oligoflexia bacterium]